MRKTFDGKPKVFLTFAKLKKNSRTLKQLNDFFILKKYEVNALIFRF